MFNCNLKSVAFAVMALGISSAYAEDGASMYRFSGFGTIGATHSTEKNADFVASVDQPSGAGHSRNWDYANDSRLGLQMDAKIIDGIAATVQLLAQHRANNSFSGDVHVANLKWQATPSTSVRVGRMLMPFYLVSDYQKIGYSMPWVRGPLEVYQIGAFSTFDGADLTYKTNVGGTTVTVQGFTGATEVKLPGGAKVYAKHELGANLTLESGYSLYRISYNQANGDLNSPLLDQLVYPAAAALPGGAAVVSQYDMHNHKKKFISAGYTYDPGNWFVMAELASLKGANDIFGLHTAYYMTGGYRVNAFTPYATLSRQRRDNGLDSGNPFVNAGLDGLTNAGRRVVSAGVRWDFMKNTDLKLQLDHVSLDGGGSHGMLSNVSGPLGSSYNVFTTAVDFVF